MTRTTTARRNENGTRIPQLSSLAAVAEYVTGQPVERPATAATLTPAERLEQARRMAAALRGEA